MKRIYEVEIRTKLDPSGTEKGIEDMDKEFDKATQRMLRKMEKFRKDVEAMSNSTSNSISGSASRMAQKFEQTVSNTATVHGRAYSRMGQDVDAFSRTTQGAIAGISRGISSLIRQVPLIGQPLAGIAQRWLSVGASVRGNTNDLKSAQVEADRFLKLMQKAFAQPFYKPGGGKSMSDAQEAFKYLGIQTRTSGASPIKGQISASPVAIADQAALQKVAQEYLKLSAAEDKAAFVQTIFGQNAAKANQILQQHATTLAGTTGQTNQAASATANFSSVVGGLAIGLVALLAIFAVTALKTATIGDEIYRVGQKTSFSTETLSVLRVEAREAGNSFNEFATALPRFERNLVSAATGNQKLSATFRSLGIDAKQGVLSPEAAFQQFLNSFIGITDESKRASIAIQLFGRAGANLIPTFDRIAGNFEEAREHAQALGEVMGRDSVIAAHNFEVGIRDAKLRLEGLVLTIGQVGIPILNALFKVIQFMLPGIIAVTVAFAAYKVAVLAIAAANAIMTTSFAAAKAAAIAFITSTGGILLIATAIAGIISWLYNWATAEREVNIVSKETIDTSARRIQQTKNEISILEMQVDATKNSTNAISDEKEKREALLAQKREELRINQELAKSQELASVNALIQALKNQKDAQDALTRAQGKTTVDVRSPSGAPVPTAGPEPFDSGKMTETNNKLTEMQDVSGKAAVAVRQLALQTGDSDGKLQELAKTLEHNDEILKMFSDSIGANDKAMGDTTAIDARTQRLEAQRQAIADLKLATEDLTISQGGLDKVLGELENRRRAFFASGETNINVFTVQNQALIKQADEMASKLAVANRKTGQSAADLKKQRDDLLKQPTTTNVPFLGNIFGTDLTNVFESDKANRIAEQQLSKMDSIREKHTRHQESELERLQKEYRKLTGDVQSFMNVGSQEFTLRYKISDLQAFRSNLETIVNLRRELGMKVDAPLPETFTEAQDIVRDLQRVKSVRDDVRKATEEQMDAQTKLAVAIRTYEIPVVDAATRAQTTYLNALRERKNEEAEVTAQLIVLAKQRKDAANDETGETVRAYQNLRLKIQQETNKLREDALEQNILAQINANGEIDLRQQVEGRVQIEQPKVPKELLDINVNVAKIADHIVAQTLTTDTGIGAATAAAVHIINSVRERYIPTDAAKFNAASFLPIAKQFLGGSGLLRAIGQGNVHNSPGFGYDHRNAFDVGLDPQSSEGKAFRDFLISQSVPFQAFYKAVPGASQGKHIHVGLPSHHTSQRFRVGTMIPANGYIPPGLDVTSEVPTTPTPSSMPVGPITQILDLGKTLIVSGINTIKNLPYLVGGKGQVPITNTKTELQEQARLTAEAQLGEAEQNRIDQRNRVANEIIKIEKGLATDSVRRETEVVARERELQGARLQDIRTTGYEIEVMSKDLAKARAGDADFVAQAWKHAELDQINEAISTRQQIVKGLYDLQHAGENSADKYELAWINAYRGIQQANEDANISIINSTVTLADQQIYHSERANAKVLEFLAQQKSMTDIVSDFKVDLINQTYGGIDSLFEKLIGHGNKLLQVFASLTASLLKLALNPIMAQLFGTGGTTGAGGGGFLNTVFGGGGGPGGTPYFNGSSSFVGGSSGGGVGPIGAQTIAAALSGGRNPFSSSTFGNYGASNYGVPTFNGTTLSQNVANQSSWQKLAQNFPALPTGAGSLSKLGATFAPAVPLLGGSLGASLGGAIGGRTGLSGILGSLGGGALGLAGGIGIASLLSPGIFTATTATSAGGALGSFAGIAGFLTNPFTIAAAGALLVGAFFLNRNKQRKSDEVARTNSIVTAMQQIRDIVKQVDRGRVDPDDAIPAAEQVRANYLSEVGQLKDKKTRDIAVKDVSRLDVIINNELKPAIQRARDRALVKQQLTPEYASGGFVTPDWTTQTSQVNQMKWIKVKAGEKVVPAREQSRLLQFGGILSGVDNGRDDMYMIAPTGTGILNRTQQRAVDEFDDGGMVTRITRAPFTQNVIGNTDKSPIILRVTLPAPVLNIGPQEATKISQLSASTLDGRKVHVEIVRDAIERGEYNT
jgi:hypothetical protein